MPRSSAVLDRLIAQALPILIAKLDATNHAYFLSDPNARQSAKDLVAQEALSLRHELQQSSLNREESIYRRLEQNLKEAHRCTNRATARKAAIFLQFAKRRACVLMSLLLQPLRLALPAVFLLLAICAATTLNIELRTRWETSELIKLSARNQELEQAVANLRPKAAIRDRLNLRFGPADEIYAEVPLRQWPQPQTQNGKSRGAWILLSASTP